MPELRFLVGGSEDKKALEIKGLNWWAVKDSNLGPMD